MASGARAHSGTARPDPIAATGARAARAASRAALSRRPLAPIDALIFLGTRVSNIPSSIGTSI
jgi:hypothetical protein